MSNQSLKSLVAAAFLLIAAGCAAPVPEAKTPEPPQNLLGSTDELQLVTELSTDLGSRYGYDQVLVVLDVDNTLLTTAQSVPCGTPEANAGPQPVQDNTAEQVQRMQSAGLKVIVLSSRGPDCRQQTLADMNPHGISFQASAWPPRGGFPEPFVPEGATLPVNYEDGIFLTAGQDKGLMLKALLEKSESPFPQLIIMADHEQENLNSVMRAFAWSPTKVHAWLYTGVDVLAAQR